MQRFAVACRILLSKRNFLHRLARHFGALRAGGCRGDVCGVRISFGALHTSRIPLCLDRFSRWIPSMGTHTASAMDEELGCKQRELDDPSEYVKGFLSGRKV